MKKIVLSLVAIAIVAAGFIFFLDSKKRRRWFSVSVDRVQE
ncbi:hypothetical protein [Aerococcus urinae]|nr:hypothetical protein [Aerococcus urinae]